jgi:glycosyltransferase involved in cell wall biosynthesis
VWRDGVRVLLNTLPEGLLHTRVPQVTVLHDLTPLAFPDQFPRQQLYFRRLVPALLRQSRVVVVGSEATKQGAIAQYGLPPAKIRTIAWGYDSTRFRPDGERPRDAGSPYVLAVGNLLPHKNLARLVEAVGQAQRSHPLRLVAAGQGRPAEIRQLRTRAEALHVDLDLRSYVAPGELATLYRGAAVVAVPSLTEGFGITALEAMASGTPVVASNRSSLPEVVGEAGLLVDPTDVEEIAAALLRTLTEASLRQDLVARGLARARAFSWERAAFEVLTVLEEVAAECGKP